MWKRIAGHRYAAWLAGLTLVVLVVLILLVAADYSYFVHGVATTATILDVEVKPAGLTGDADRGGGAKPLPERRIRYQYQDKLGVPHLGEISVTAGPGVPAPYRRGQKINVLYLDNSPATSRIAASGRLADQSWGVALVLAGIGAGIIALALWWTRQESFAELLSRIEGRAVFPGFKQRRRARLLRSPLPPDWLEFLLNNVAIYRRLTVPEQQTLQNDLRIFLAEKNWEGCGGLTVTDEIKVTIAAQACVLLLGLDHDYFSHVPSILVYPTGFAIPEKSFGPDGIVDQGVGTLGEAWYRGPVVLAWDEVLAGGRNQNDGQNVVYHEFAHQLDFLGQWGQGRARQGRRQQMRHWQEVMGREYDRLVADSERGKATLLDQYGATSPAEFFAVATECFFEQPVLLRRRHPQLYEVLRNFYGQDPARRVGP